MNKVSIALLSCCLALPGTLAFADDMAGDKMNNGSMSMEKPMSSDGMDKDSMKTKSDDKKMMKKEHKAKRSMTHKKSKKHMRKDKVEHQDTMQRMQ